MLTKRDAQPKSAREIQRDELRRRRAEWKAKGSDVAVAKPFVCETVPASPKDFCWFCFESDLKLFVAGGTGIWFCQECAESLIALVRKAPAEATP